MQVMMMRRPAVLLLLTALLGLSKGYPGIILNYNTGTHLRQEMGQPGRAVTGEYRWLTEDGKENFVKYTADENGYVARGNIVPGYYEPLTNPKLLQSVTSDDPLSGLFNEKSAVSGSPAENEIPGDVPNDLLAEETHLETEKELPGKDASPEETVPQTEELTNEATKENVLENEIEDDSVNPIKFPEDSNNNTPGIKAANNNPAVLEENEITFPETNDDKKPVVDDGSLFIEMPQKDVPTGYQPMSPAEELPIDLLNPTKAPLEKLDSTEDGMSEPTDTPTLKDAATEDDVDDEDVLEAVTKSADFDIKDLIDVVLTTLSTVEVATTEPADIVKDDAVENSKTEEITTVFPTNAEKGDVITELNLGTTVSDVLVSSNEGNTVTEPVIREIPDADTTTENPTYLVDSEDGSISGTQNPFLASIPDNSLDTTTVENLPIEPNLTEEVVTENQVIRGTFNEESIPTTDSTLDNAEAVTENIDVGSATYNIRNSITESDDAVNKEQIPDDMDIPTEPNETPGEPLDDDQAGDDDSDNKILDIVPAEDSSLEASTQDEMPTDNEGVSNTPSVVIIDGDPDNQLLEGDRPPPDEQDQPLFSRRPYRPRLPRPCSTPHFHYPPYYRHPPHFHNPPYRHNPPPGHYQQSFRPYLKFFPGKPRPGQKKPNKGIFFNIFS